MKILLALVLVCFTSLASANSAVPYGEYVLHYRNYKPMSNAVLNRLWFRWYQKNVYQR